MSRRKNGYLLFFKAIDTLPQSCYLTLNPSSREVQAGGGTSRGRYEQGAAERQTNNHQPKRHQPMTQKPTFFNISNLHEHQTISSYPALCQILSIEPKNGASKRSQLKDLSRHCSFTQQGHTFTIDEIYPYPLPKPPKADNKWITDIETVLLDFLAREIEKDNSSNPVKNTKISPEKEKLVSVVYLDRKDLIILSGLCSGVFFKERAAYNRNPQPAAVGDAFFTDSSSKMKDVIRSLCDSLKSRKIVVVDEVYIYQKKGEGNEVWAREEADYPTAVRISEVYGSVLTHPMVDCSSEFDVVRKGKSEVYYYLVGKGIEKELGLVNVKRSYKFGFTEGLRERTAARKKGLEIVREAKGDTTEKMVGFLEIKLKERVDKFSGWGAFDFKEKRKITGEEIRERYEREWMEYVERGVRGG